MLTPRSASFRAMPRPIPRELPVTSACFPWSGMSTSFGSAYSEQRPRSILHPEESRRRLPSSFLLPGILAAHYFRHSAQQNAEVHRQIPLAHQPQIQPAPLAIRQAIAPGDLPQSRESGLNAQDLAGIGAVVAAQ